MGVNSPKQGREGARPFVKMVCEHAPFWSTLPRARIIHAARVTLSIYLVQGRVKHYGYAGKVGFGELPRGYPLAAYNHSGSTNLGKQLPAIGCLRRLGFAGYFNGAGLQRDVSNRLRLLPTQPVTALLLL